MPKVLILLIILISQLFSQKTIFADSHVIINEFVSDVASGEKEWVEFYNPGLSDQSLDGWTLEEKTGTDLSGTASYSLDGITVSAGAFMVYEFPTIQSKLNNGGDVLTLKNGPTIIDEIAYGSAPNSEVGAPKKGQSAGRKADGSDHWVIFEPPTKQSSNNSGQPVQPAPTPSPSPVQSPSSSSTSAPAKSPSPTPKATPKPSPQATPKSQATSSPISQNVLGQKETDTPSSSPEQSSPSPKIQNSQSRTKVAGIITGFGLILVGLSFAFYLWYKRLLGSPKKEQDKDESQ